MKEVNEVNNKLQGKSRFKKIMRYFARFIFILFFFISIFVLLMLHSTSFRQFVVGKVLVAANNFLLADITIKDLYFNGLSNIIIEDVLVITGNDTLADIRKVDIKYKLNSLLTSNIQVNKIELTNPKIALLRSKQDSIWNYKKIAKPSENVTPKDTTASELKIVIGQIVINEGSFKYWDSLANWHNSVAYFRPIQMNWNIAHFDANNIVVNPGKSYYTINIANLTTNETNSYIDIKQFSSRLKASKNGFYAYNTDIILVNRNQTNEHKINNEAHLTFNAGMTNYNVFNKTPLKIEDAIMSLDMDVNNFDCDFIDNFAVLPIKLGSINKLNISVNGTLTDMKVPNLQVNVNKTNLELKDIELTNLTSPDLLTYKGNIINTSIFTSDIQTFFNPSHNTAIDIPTFNREDAEKRPQQVVQHNKKNITLPDMANKISDLLIKNTYFSGSINSFSSDLDVNTNIGGVVGPFNIAFGGGQDYNMDLCLDNVNIGYILDNPLLFSNINSRIKINGSKFDINEMNVDVDLTLYPSTFNRHIIDTSHISLTYNANDKLKINDCKIVLHNRRSNANIIIGGEINLGNTSPPKTNLTISLQNLRPFYMFRDSALPRSFTGDIDISAIGNDINCLVANAKIDVKEIRFDNKSLFPFDIVLSANLQDLDNPQTNYTDSTINPTFKQKDATNNNSIYISANNDYRNIFDISMVGKFNLESVVYYLQRDLDLLTNYISGRVNSDEIAVLNKEAHLQNVARNNEEIDIELSVRTTGLAYLDFVDDNIEFNSTNTLTKLRYNANEFNSNIIIDSINIYELDISAEKDRIVVDSLLLNGKIGLQDTKNDLINLLEFSINSKKEQRYNDITLGNVKIDITRKKQNQMRDDNSELSYNISGSLNNFLNLKTAGSLITDKKIISLTLDTLLAEVNKHLYTNNNAIKITYSGSKISINDFNLVNNRSGGIKLNGSIADNVIDSLILRVNDMEIGDILSSLGLEMALGGTIDSIFVIADGSFSSPVVSSVICIEDLHFDGYGFGNFQTKLNYHNKNISGISSIMQRNKELLSLSINKFPLSLAIDSTLTQIDTNNKIDISLRIKELPSQVVEPFVPEVDNLSGLIDGNFNISGYLPDRYEYNGELTLNNLRMRIAPINMHYIVTGKIHATTNLISFKELKVKNTGQDIHNGEAIIDGMITFAGLNFDSFDIVTNTKQFQILSDNTKLSMPFFYGKMIIATGEQPLRIYGTLKEPNLMGSVNIINGDIKMPQILNNQVAKRETKFNYISKADIIFDTSNGKEIILPTKDTPQESFVDLLNIDLNLRINRFAIALELGNIGNIFARVGTKEPNAQLTYRKLRTSNEAKLYGGELEILDGSTLQIFKTMLAKGTISFPSARISQPRLDLSAEYKGKTAADYPVNYSVFVTVKGTPQNPLIDLNYAINGNMVMGDKQQVQIDAFNALTRGIVKGYNDGGGSNLLGENNLVSLAASQYASKQLTDMLLKTGIIQSVNLKFDDNDFDFNSANVSFSGLLGNYATWTLGGKVTDIESSYNASIDIPFYFNTKTLNNMLLQLSKSTDVNNAAFDKNAKDWEISLKFHGKW